MPDTPDTEPTSTETGFADVTSVENVDAIADGGHSTQLSDSAKEFLLVEYEYRRQDILQRIQRIEEQIRYGLLASGVIWTWILTHRDPVWFELVVWIPAIIVAFFTVTWLTQHFAIMGVADYLRDRIEPKFLLPEGTGWETQYVSYRNTWLFRLTNFFWFGLLAANVIGAWVAPTWVGAPNPMP